MNDKQYESIAESMWNTYKGLASFIYEKSIKPQKGEPGYSKKKRTKLGQTLRGIKQAGQRYASVEGGQEAPSIKYAAVEPHITAAELRRKAEIESGTGTPEGSLATRVFRGSRTRTGTRRS